MLIHTPIINVKKVEMCTLFCYKYGVVYRSILDIIMKWLLEV